MKTRMRAIAMVGAMLPVAAGIAQLGGATGGEGGRVGGGFGGGGLGARAQLPRPEKPVWLCIGAAVVEEGEEIGGLVAFGPVTVGGKVHGDVTSFGGAIVVRKTGVIAGNVTAVCADITVAEGATVEGAVQARQLPDMASIDVGWPGPDAMRIIFGDAEIAPGDGPIGPRVVIGGNATVRRGAAVSEVAAIGGDVTIEEGTEVSAVRIAGGRLQRPGGKAEEKDETIEPVTLTCEGLPHEDPNAPAAAWTTSTVDHGTDSMRLVTQPASEWQRTIQLMLGNGRWSLSLHTQIAAVVREPAPEPEKAGQFKAYPAWTGWPLYAPADSSPAFAKSTAVGVGLHIGVSQAISQAGSQRSGSRTVTMAVPASAKTLTEALGGYGPGVGGGYGSYGSGYRGRGSIGGASRGADQ